MKKKVLFVATVVKGHIDVFHIPYLKMFKDMGWETSVFANNNYKNESECVIPYCDNYYNAPFTRNPLSIGNVKSYKQLKKLIKDNNYDIIHCHTPVGGVITRLAAKKIKSKKTKVYYTAHGFHFFKGAPLKNWLVYYPIEKYLSKYTDHLIVMNEEDCIVAKENMYSKKTTKINGIGINLDKFNSDENPSDKLSIDNIKINKNDFVTICVGELNKNKNQLFLIDVIDEARKNIPNIKLFIIGEGIYKSKLEEKISELNLQEYIFLLGYRKDISELLSLANVLFSVSYREGLPVNVIEAMAMGLPVIASSCRGNVDLIESGKNGFILNNYDCSEYSNKLERLYLDKELYKKISLNNKKKSMNYSIDSVQKVMKDIYLERN